MSRRLSRWIVIGCLAAAEAAAWAQPGAGSGAAPGPATGAPPSAAAGSGSGSATAPPGAGAGSGSATAPPGAGSGSGSAAASSGDDDLGDIEAALASDSAAQKKAHPAPSPAPTAAVATGAGPAQSMNPDLSFIADFALASFSAPNLEAGDHDPHDDGFNLQALELAASKAVDPYFKFNANLAFSKDGVEIEEAYATTLDLPHSLQVRAGQFLTKFGRINATHPHTWTFSDQPFAMSRIFGGDGNRGVGVEVSWLTPLPWYVEVLGSVTDPRGDTTARSFLPSDATLSNLWDVESILAVRQFFDLSDDLSLMWGLSWAGGPSSLADHTRSDVFGTDVYLKYRPITFGSYTIVSLQSEWLYRRREEAMGGPIWDVDGYAELFWRFRQRWGAGARYDYGSAARSGGMVVVDPLDPEWTRARHRVSADVTFWPTEFSRLRAQVQVDDPRWTDPIYAGFLTLELSLGVHGAHSF